MIASRDVGTRRSHLRYHPINDFDRFSGLIALKAGTLDSHEQFLDFSFGTQVLIVKQIRAMDQNAPTYTKPLVG